MYINILFMCFYFFVVLEVDFRALCLLRQVLCHWITFLAPCCSPFDGDLHCFHFWMLWIMWLWTWVYRYLIESLFSVLLSIYLEVELPDHRIILFFLWKTTNCFPRADFLIKINKPETVGCHLQYVEGK